MRMRLPPTTAAIRLFLGLAAVAALRTPAAENAAAGAPAPDPVPAATTAEENPLRLAEGLQGRGFYDLALQEIGRVAAGNPSPETAARAALLRVECLRGQGKTAEALDAVRQFQHDWPQHPRTPALLLVRAELLVQAGKTAEAAQQLEALRAQADSGIQESAGFQLARLALQRQDTAAALAFLEPLAARPPDAKFPCRAYALLSAGIVHQQRGETAAATAAFTRLADAAGAPAELRAEAVFRLGELAFLQTDFATAQTWYGRLLSGKDAEKAGAWGREAKRRLAWCRFYARDYAGAQADIAAWEKLVPAGAGATERDYLTALCRAGIGRHAEALALLEALLKSGTLSPDYQPLVRFQRIFCLTALERWEEAFQAARDFRQLHPQTPERADVAYFAGVAARHLGRQEDAGQAFQEALAAAPPGWTFFRDASLQLTDTFLALNRPRDAAAVFRTLGATSGVEGRAALLLKAGDLELGAGQTDAAAADFAKLRQNFPQAPEFQAATLKLARIEADRQNYAAAAGLVKELLAAGDAQDQGRMLLFSGFLAHVQQRYAEAETPFRQVLARPDTGPALAAEAKYYLAATLLENNREPEGLALFAELLALPDEFRPAFPDPLLLRLQEAFYQYRRLDDSLRVCRRLMDSPSPETAARGRLQQARVLAAQNQAEAAAAALEPLLKPPAADSRPGTPAPPPVVRKEALALSGDLYAAAGQADRAVTAFTEALRPPAPARGEAGARARLGLARIFVKEGHDAQALEQAVSAFVLENDPVFTPQAMFLAVEILVRQGKTAEAGTTWAELRQRFPVFAESRKQEPAVKTLAAEPAPANGEK